MLIDVTRLVGRFLKRFHPTGIDRVMLAYIERYSESSQALVHYGGRTLVLCQEKSRKIFALLLDRPTDFSVRALQVLILAWGNWRQQKGWEGALLLNLGHANLMDPAYFSMVRRLGLKPVFFVHDLIPISHAEYCRAGDRDKHVLRMRNVLEHASGVIANSQATLQELEQFAASLERPMPPAIAALLAPARVPAFRGVAPPLSAPYFVMLGTIEARKNHWLLLQVWRRLVDRFGAGAPKLVLIGRRGWECENVIDLLERCEALRDAVIERPSCSDAEMVGWLIHARALLFPSFVEGYGLPLVEALAAGTPVIASDLAVFREVAGDIPNYLDPLDAMGWLELVVRYADPAGQERMVQLEKLAGFAPPSWESHFHKVDCLLARLAPAASQEVSV